MSALAGVDQALWDLKGQRLGVPVYELLGGAVRDRMKVYCWVGGDRPEGVAAAAREKVADGYRAVKMNATAEMDWIDTPAAVDAVGRRAAAVREAVGDEVGVGIDFHGRVRRGMAKRLVHALEPHAPMFVEEPVLPEHNDVLPVLQRHTTIPIATGERMFSRWDFREVFEDRSVDVIQPDLSHAGGISEVKKIAAMAEAYDVGLAPHCPLGPIAFAAALQVDFACPNAFIQETSLNIHYNEDADLLDYLSTPEVFAFEDGYVARPTGPGLGVEVDEAAVRARADTGHDWKNPIWRADDGSLTEW
jgi:galactonate dehydratase